jgi:lysophospholipase L1-like esterase
MVSAQLVALPHKELLLPLPPILAVCPPPIRSPQGAIPAKFAGAEQGCAGLADAYRAICAELGCHFSNAARVTSSSWVDGVHLDVDQHVELRRALADVVAPMLAAG